jgi:endonuclease/exonuclease/phosphatase family metal-dependent hydrolase
MTQKTLKETTMNLRFISWNIHGRNHVSHQLELLRTTAGDLVALQEVTIAAYQELVASKLYAWSAFSLDIRPPQPNEGPGRRLGCALFGQAPFRLKQSFLLESAPLPERTLIVEADSPTGPLNLVSFHTPPGVSWKKMKPLALLALAQWLAQHETRVVVGMDANAPKTDHPNIQQNEWWWQEEPLMLGPEPLHSLKDALRIWLAAHPSEAEECYALRPRGPLAISYDRGKRVSVPCRYDFIYITPDFSVSQIHYLYEDAIRAGSDHAVVISDLTLPLTCTSALGYNQL